MNLSYCCQLFLESIFYLLAHHTDLQVLPALVVIAAFSSHLLPHFVIRFHTPRKMATEHMQSLVHVQSSWGRANKSLFILSFLPLIHKLIVTPSFSPDSS